MADQGQRQSLTAVLRKKPDYHVENLAEAGAKIVWRCEAAHTSSATGELFVAPLPN